MHFGRLVSHILFMSAELGYLDCQNFVTNAWTLELEERILQTDQLKNTSKHLQHRVDRTLYFLKQLSTFRCFTNKNILF